MSTGFSPSDFEIVEAPATMPSAPTMRASDFEIVQQPALSPADFEVIPDRLAPAPESRSRLQSGLLDPMGRGWNQLQSNAMALLNSTGLVSNETFARNVIDNQLDALQYPMQPNVLQQLDAVRATAERDGIMSGVGSALTENIRGTGDVALTSAVSSSPGIASGVGGALAGAAVGGPVGAVIGGVAGAGLGSGLTEFGAARVDKIQDYLRDNKLPVTEANIVAVLNNPDQMAAVNRHAAIRATAVGAFDAVGAGVAGRVAGPVARAVTPMGGRVAAVPAAVAGELGAQAATGMAGEAAAGALTDGVKPFEVVMEGAAGALTGAVEVPGMIAAQRRAARTAMPNPQEFEVVQAPDAPAPAPAAPEPQLAQAAPAEPAPLQPPAGQPAGLAPAAGPETAPAAPAGPEPVPAPPEPAGGQVAGVAPAPAPVAPAPVVQQGPDQSAPVAPAPTGGDPAAPAPANPRRSRVSTPDGVASYDTEFEVVDASQLQPATGDLQPRDRATRAASTDQINEIASRLDPNLLIDSPQSDRGAPIVDDNGVVLSGNGRVAALARARELNNEGAQAYRQRLIDEGYNVEGIANPVLVRRLRGLTPEQKRDFVVRSNKDDKLAMSPSEQARVDRDLISDDMLRQIDVDTELGFNAAGNQSFVRSLLSKLSASERAGFVDNKGYVTPAGARRIDAAVFSRAYDDAQLTNRIVEDEEGGGTRNALLGAAPAWAQMKAVADPKLDVTQELIAAINALATIRQNKGNLTNFLAQQDAFDQLSPVATGFLKAFYNPNGTRVAAWRDTRDFIREYAKAAVDEARSVGQLDGRAKTPIDIINELEARRGRGEDLSGQQAGLFGDAAPGNPPPTQATTAQPQSAVTPPSPQPTAAPSPPKAEQDRIPRGGLAPTFSRLSKNEGAPVSESAFRDAGLDPDTAINLPIGRQIAVLGNLLAQKMGFRNVSDVGTVSGGKAKPIDARDQLLNAYYNLQVMAHALGLPLNAFGLNGTLSLSLSAATKRTPYLGVYSPGNRSIELPGRSNSFAHEWGHALDHFLSMKLMQRLGAAVANNNLLTDLVEKGVLDPTQNTIEAKYAKLMLAMYNDGAGLATQMINIQMRAASGDPQAIQQMEEISKGQFRGQNIESEFARTSQYYGALGGPAGAKYFKSPVEMFARAFEAYVAERMSQVAPSTAQSFVTKGDLSYRESADLRMRQTFPRAADRLAIFQAFDELMADLQQQAMFGPDAVAKNADPQDVLDLRHYTKLMATQPPTTLAQEVQRELGVIRNVIGQIFSGDVRGVRARLMASVSQRVGPGTNTTGRGEGVLASLKSGAVMVGATIRGVGRIIARRYEGDARMWVEAMASHLNDDPGSGRFVRDPFEKEIRREMNKTTNAIVDVLRANGFRDSLPKDSAERVWSIMLGQPTPNATAQERAVAADFRRRFDQEFRKNTAAGIDIGYAKDPYLTRIIEPHLVEADQAGFLAKAEQVEQLTFDREVDAQGGDFNDVLDALREKRGEVMGRNYSREEFLNDPQATGALKALNTAVRAYNRNQTAQNEQALRDALVTFADELRPLWSKAMARRWMEHILLGDTFSGMGQNAAANFTKERRHGAYADELLKDYRVADPMELLVRYAHASARKRATLERFGNPNLSSSESMDLEAALARKPIREAVQSNPRKYNPGTAKGRLAIIDELLPKNEYNLMAMRGLEALRAGVSAEHIQWIKDNTDVVTGLAFGSNSWNPAKRLQTFLYTVGTLTLLPRTIWTSVTEPLTMYLRTGSATASLATFGQYMKEAVRSAQSTQEVAALARAMGRVTEPFYDAIIQHALSANTADSISSQKLIAQFFMRTGLTHLTNAQKRSALVGQWVWFTELAKDIKNPTKGWGMSAAAKAEIARADFRELGIPADKLDDFVDWVLQKDGALPGLNDLDSEAGRLFEISMNRLGDQIIQEATKADKPAFASHPWGRMIFAIQSFNLAFTRNVHLRAGIRTERNAQIVSDIDGTNIYANRAGELAKTTAVLAAGFSAMIAGQMAMSVLREAIFNGDKWEEKEKAGELGVWLRDLAVSRSGLFGIADPFIQAYTGLRYERDLTALVAGAHASLFLNTLLQPLGTVFFPDRNSPNSNTAENKAMRGLYATVAAPAIAAGLSVLPGGPLTGTAMGFGLQLATSGRAADAFADATAGPRPPPKPKKTNDPWAPQRAPRGQNSGAGRTMF